MTWCVSWQDYRNWRKTDVREPRPPIERRFFEHLADAGRERELRKLAGMTVCIEELRPIRRRGTVRKPRRKLVQLGPLV